MDDYNLACPLGKRIKIHYKKTKRGEQGRKNKRGRKCLSTYLLSYRQIFPAYPLNSTQELKEYSFVANNFYNPIFWAKENSQHSVCTCGLSFFETIKDVSTLSNTYAGWLATYLLTINLDYETTIRAISFRVYHGSRQVYLQCSSIYCRID